MGLEPTTLVAGEPALSFRYDAKRSLYEQFSRAHGRQHRAQRAAVGACETFKGIGDRGQRTVRGIGQRINKVGHGRGHGAAHQAVDEVLCRADKAAAAAAGDRLHR